MSAQQAKPIAIAVVDTAGQLVAFERMDITQTGIIGVSGVSAEQDGVVAKAGVDGVK